MSKSVEKACCFFHAFLFGIVPPVFIDSPPWLQRIKAIAMSAKWFTVNLSGEPYNAQLGVRPGGVSIFVAQIDLTGALIYKNQGVAADDDAYTGFAESYLVRRIGKCTAVLV